MAGSGATAVRLLDGAGLMSKAPQTPVTPTNMLCSCRVKVGIRLTRRLAES